MTSATMKVKAGSPKVQDILAKFQFGSKQKKTAAKPLAAETLSVIFMVTPLIVLALVVLCLCRSNVGLMARMAPLVGGMLLVIPLAFAFGGPSKAKQ
jgi:hypothetical protein